jgi:hypothetical protein
MKYLTLAFFIGLVHFFLKLVLDSRILGQLVHQVGQGHTRRVVPTIPKYIITKKSDTFLIL